MRTECEDALSGLCDGERVDPELVAEALADGQAAAAYLIAIAETRAALAGEAEAPSPAFDERMFREFGKLEANHVMAFVRRVAGHPARMVTLGAAAGLIAGVLIGPQVLERTGSPPGPEANASTATRDAPPSEALPGRLSERPLANARPDFVFEPGRDWREGE